MASSCERIKEAAVANEFRLDAQEQCCTVEMDKVAKMSYISDGHVFVCFLLTA